MTESTEQKCEVRLVSCCSCCRRDCGGPALHHPPRHVHRLQNEEGGRGKLRSQRTQALAQRSFVSQSSVERILCVNIDFDDGYGDMMIQLNNHRKCAQYQFSRKNIENHGYPLIIKRYLKKISIIKF